MHVAIQKLAASAPLSSTSRRNLTNFYKASAVLVLLAIVISGISSELKAPQVVSGGIFFCTIVPLIIVFNLMYVAGLTSEAKKRSEEFEKKGTGSWNSAVEKWERTYYCEVEGIVFDRNDPNDWADVYDMEKYLSR